MDIGFLGRGLILGFSIAAPVGPIGVLCIRRTLTEGLASGFLSGLGAATADAIYGCIAGFGLTFVADLLVEQTLWIRLIGGLFLCYLGVKTILSKPAEAAISGKSRSLFTAYASTVVLTLTNPATILSFAAVFAGLGLASAGGNYAAAGILVLGVFLGSALWWCLLSGGVSVLRRRFNAEGLQWLNRISGAILLAFGAIALSLRG
ncbi:MAG: LysE family transporter [Leptolyngbyaceae cyanobacterium RM2_2_4]|nr:LysE family transporter [Leptolyngbyaceae cyanobacterium SM1_4_3]NJO51182.1 LysE family transporter [Leptolyngbyaceae cyanobacterium RM2_2_4]